MSILRTVIPALATVSAAGIYFGIRSIQAAQLTVVNSTLFENYRGNHLDVYQTTFDTPIDIRKFASCFFRSPVFQAERIVLKLFGYGDIVDDSIDALKFEPQDEVVVFQVVERKSDEMVFAWKLSSTTFGNSWFHVDENGHTLHYGTTMSTSKPIPFLILNCHLLYAQIVLASARYQYNKESTK
ncbi:hypothetical protein THRCLA_04376 [Thraustotheca clavata]|uniref:Secreted protein n=1 Tax=Thraustotheca clavata TaxID=74557 RepID=A0A1V9ZZ84_9STRA|nr:hypothetical protein THRCLA_04376 [Thraustotheca clavata]